MLQALNYDESTKVKSKSFITSNYHFIQLNRWEMFNKALHSVLIYVLHNIPAFFQDLGCKCARGELSPTSASRSTLQSIKHLSTQCSGFTAATSVVWFTLAAHICIVSRDSGRLLKNAKKKPPPFSTCPAANAKDDD